VGAGAAALAAVMYGSSYVATAFALRSFSPLGVAATRGTLGVIAVALVLTLPIAPSVRQLRLTRAAAWRLTVLAALGGPAFIVAMSLAVSSAGATITAFVAGLYAVLAAAFAIPILRERPEPSTALALLMALAGTALLGELRVDGSVAPGIGIGLVAACLFGLFLVLSRRWSGPYRLPGPVVAAATLALTALSVGALLLVRGEPPLAHDLRPDAAAAIVWLAIGPGALAAVLIVTGMRRIPARRASALLLLNPPTATLGAWLLLGERLTALQLVGGLLVLVAIAAASGLRLRRGEG
jgi:probable blue pigment (indigoidine) exporter